MRRQDKSTPSVPPITPEEEDAQSFLRRVRELVWFIEWFLNRAYTQLPDPPDAEAMGTGEIPESLTFSLRGSIECAQTDYVVPLHNLLRDAVQETPEHLVRNWQRRSGRALTWARNGIAASGRMARTTP